MVKHQQIFGPAEFSFPLESGPEAIEEDRPVPECAIVDPTFSQDQLGQSR